MINNKQMKVYTENQIREFLTTKQSFITLDDMYNLESIELPSDEEIFSESLNHKEPDDFNCGSQFVIDYINQQDK